MTNVHNRTLLASAFLQGTLTLFFLSTFLVTSAGGQAQRSGQSKQTQQTRPRTSPPASQQPSVPGATPIQGDDEEVVRVTSNLVVVPVSVTDATGQPVQGLTINDFRLEEEGRTQQIAQIGDPDQVPLEIALLLDVSSSVGARFAFEKEAASRFLKEVLKPVDRASIFAIDTKPRLVEARNTAEQATQKLLAFEPAKGLTAFYDTVVEAAKYLITTTPPRHRRVIVVISDGEDTYSEKHKNVAAALPEVQRADVVFYAINPSGQSLWLNKISTRGQEGMQQLATATGGTAFVPNVSDDLNAVFSQIANELRSQYLLQYYPSTNAPASKFLRIAVKVPARSELRVRARQGYYSPQK
ncbi:MAG: VWA domain-containing protein [Pyrinomonadaceae bacterium]|nr:VWA domain-containing protein [Pyrinomonadaceae bacterium]